MTAEDTKFVEALQAAGLLRELERPELEQLSARLNHDSAEARQLDLVELYYEVGPDAEVAERRAREERFFTHHADWDRSAHDVVRSLARVFPELGEITIERIGDDAESTLVLRAGEFISAVFDEQPRQLDRDERHPHEVDSERPTVSVRSLVRALNGLLAQVGIRARLVELLADERREVYVATHVLPATILLEQEYLEDDDAEDLMEFAAW